MRPFREGGQRGLVVRSVYAARLAYVPRLFLVYCVTLHGQTLKQSSAPYIVTQITQKYLCTPIGSVIFWNLVEAETENKRLSFSLL